LGVYNTGKLSWGEILANLRQSFICQLLAASEIAIEAGLYFANFHLACNSPNFSPAKVSLFMV